MIVVILQLLFDGRAVAVDTAWLVFTTFNRLQTLGNVLKHLIDGMSLYCIVAPSP